MPVLPFAAEATIALTTKSLTAVLVTTANTPPETQSSPQPTCCRGTRSRRRRRRCASSVRASASADPPWLAMQRKRSTKLFTACELLSATHSPTLGSSGVFCTRAARPSLLISISAACTGLATSTIAGRSFGDSTVSHSVTRLKVVASAAHLII